VRLLAVAGEQAWARLRWRGPWASTRGRHEGAGGARRRGLAERRPHATDADGRSTRSLPRGGTGSRLPRAHAPFRSGGLCRRLADDVRTTVEVLAAVRGAASEMEGDERPRKHAGRRLNRRAAAAIGLTVTGLALPATGFADHLILDSNPAAGRQRGKRRSLDVRLLFIAFATGTSSSTARRIAATSQSVRRPPFSPKGASRPRSDCRRRGPLPVCPSAPTTSRRGLCVPRSPATNATTPRDAIRALGRHAAKHAGCAEACPRDVIGMMTFPSTITPISGTRSAAAAVWRASRHASTPP